MFFWSNPYKTSYHFSLKLWSHDLIYRIAWVTWCNIVDDVMDRNYVAVTLNSKYSYFANLINWLALQNDYTMFNQLSTPRCECVSGNWKPFKNDKKCFLFHLKTLLFLRYLNFWTDVFGYAGKRLHIKKVKVSFKIYNGIYWKTNHYNTHIILYLKMFYNKYGLELVSLPHSLHDFWTNVFVWLWRKFFVWLPLLLEILGKLYIVLICFPIAGVINF